MPDPVGPTFIPKAVLTAGRVAHQPFEVPTEMTKAALLQSGAVHSAVGSINKAAADAVTQLEPRGPAKLLAKLFGKVDGSLVHSAGQAKKATEVFWVPFSNGSHEIGHAVSNPFSLFYAKRAGFEIPEDPAAAQELLRSITNPNEAKDGDQSTKFPGFTFPVPAPPAEEPKPDPAGDGGDAGKPAEGGDTGETGKPAEGGETGEAGKPAEGGETGDPGKPAEGGEGSEPAATTPADGEVAATSGGGDEPAVDPAATDPAATDPAATDPAAVDPAAVDPAAADPAAADAAAAAGGDPGTSPTPEGARGIAPSSTDAASQSHPAGIDPAVMAAAAAASAGTPSTDPAPVQDAAAGADATTTPVHDDAPVQPPVQDTPAVQDAPQVQDAPAVNPGAPA